MATSRLPTVGGDVNTWGTVLNDYLTKATGQVPGSSRLFYIDAYGADPTGAALSDTAWTNCYTDASAAVQAHGGSLIVFGPGWYKFSINTVAITDTRVGIRGAGRNATVIWTAGSSGSLVKVTGTAGPTPQGAAPISGFTVYGWNGGAGIRGLEYGDRYAGTLTDVSAAGCGGASGKGFWFHDATTLSEGSFIQVLADQNTDDFVFEGSGTAGSFDYSHIILKVVATTSGPGANGSILKVINHMQMNGCYLQLSGNAQAATGQTKTVLTVGSSGTDQAVISGSQLNIMVEADTSVGTVIDATIQGASGFGIDKCNGVVYFQNVSGTYTAGSVTSPAVFRCAGYLSGPLFSSHGTLTALGTGSQLFTYAG